MSPLGPTSRAGTFMHVFALSRWLTRHVLFTVTTKAQDISLMGKVYWYKTPQVQAEQGLQISIKKTQTNVLENVPEAVSSISQIEQEDISEWGVSDAESVLFKPQDTLEVQPTDESSKPLEGEQPIADSKAAEQMSLKVKSSELLQIKGKEVTRTRKSKLGIPQQRQTKVSKPLCDPKLPKKKIPQDYSTPTLHELCATVPAQELPIDLRLASRVYHTANKKGHSTLLGVSGTSFLDNRYTDEEQRDRILQGIPSVGDNQEHVGVLPTTPGIPTGLAPGIGRNAHKPHLLLSGEEVSAYPGFTKLFWNLTSPKFSAPVSVIKEIVYPKYEVPGCHSHLPEGHCQYPGPCNPGAVCATSPQVHATVKGPETRPWLWALPIASIFLEASAGSTPTHHLSRG
ncbi:uncharacterized protein LOC125136636 [Phacochoerus africanus]|uniref:uncharacterized protein LOC125136636 n=1 Tax=Phacochoerus africanus TaxID=41426 RepID=UPI001FD892B8|nr:uncharacterized protein LOC125136636 [Phacochoerus africanus]